MMETPGDLSPVSFQVIWQELLSEEFDLNDRVEEVTEKEFRDEVGVQVSDFDTELEMPEPSKDVSTSLSSNETENRPNEFINVNTDDVNKFIENETNRNTLRKTHADVEKFRRYLGVKNVSREIHEINHEQLDELLAGFILSVRKASGDEYEPSSLRNLVSSIDRKLKRHRYPHKIMGDVNSNAFSLTRETLRAKQKSLKRLGKGNKPMRSSPISDEEINILYERGVLGPSSAKSLLNTVWFNNCVHFGLRGTQENYQLRWGDVELKKGSDGCEYLQLNERQTKTRTVENVNDVRDVPPKIFELPDCQERCPVKAYKLYAEKRPKDFCFPDSPFYIAPKTPSQNSNKSHWYMKMIVGQKKLSQLLKQMAIDGGLDSGKTLTNHSARKHLVQKLRDSGIAPTDIMQISGHKNMQSVLNYSNMSEKTQKTCSNILSNTLTCRTNSTIPDPDPSEPYESLRLPHIHRYISDSGVNVDKYQPGRSTADTIHRLQDGQILASSNNIDLNTRQSPIQPNPNAHNVLPQQSSLGPQTQTADNFTRNAGISHAMQMNSVFSGAVLNIQTLNVYTGNPCQHNNGHA